MGSIAAAAWIAGILLTAVANCSRTSQDAAPPATSPPVEGAASTTDMFKLYDPSSLIEVRSVSELPDGLRQIEAGMMEAPGEGPHSRCCQFLIAGASDTSALVAYEEFGYVGTFLAKAYVHVASGWTEAHGWVIGSPTTLRELKEMTSLPVENYDAWKPPPLSESL
jgi:hypothetical protein